MMDGCVVFSDVVAQVVWARLPIVATPSSVVLSVCIGVGGCLWPIVYNSWRAGIASLQSTKRAPNSASAVEDMTAFMICEMVRTDPLFSGTAESS